MANRDELEVLALRSRRLRVSWFPLVTLLAAGACGLAQPASAEIRQVGVGNETIAVEELGGSGPVVIFESGLGEPFDSFTEAAKSLSSCMRVVMYDRPGIGASGPRAESGPAMADDVAQGLHALIGKLGLPGPYVVVGHSLGGFYAQIFARRYPSDIAAVVLIDAASQFEPPGVFVSKVRPEPGSVAAAEEEGMRLGEATANSEPPFPPVPLIVLAATDHEMSADLEQLWQATQAKLPGLSPKGKLEVVSGAGHFIQTDRPDAVIAAVKEATRDAGLSVETCAP